MQNFSNGRPRLERNARPVFDEDLIEDLAEELVELAQRSGRRGIRIDYSLVRNALDENDALARAVLRHAGFKPCPAQWCTGRGNADVGNFTYPPNLADRLTNILEDYEL